MMSPPPYVTWRQFLPRFAPWPKCTVLVLLDQRTPYLHIWSRAIYRDIMLRYDGSFSLLYKSEIYLLAYSQESFVRLAQVSGWARLYHDKLWNSSMGFSFSEVECNKNPYFWGAGIKSAVLTPLNEKVFFSRRMFSVFQAAVFKPDTISNINKLKSTIEWSQIKLLWVEKGAGEAP